MSTSRPSPKPKLKSTAEAKNYSGSNSKLSKASKAKKSKSSPSQPQSQPIEQKPYPPLEEGLLLKGTEVLENEVAVMLTAVAMSFDTRSLEIVMRQDISENPKIQSCSRPHYCRSKPDQSMRP